MSKRMGTKPLKFARYFMMQCQMTLMMGGDNDDVDDSGNANNIDSAKEK